MDASTLAIIIAGISLIIASSAECRSRRFLEQQWKRDELVIRRDVLRRFCGYRYRLTEGLKGTDGEPFVALNEAAIVYADFPKVVNALRQLHYDSPEEGSLARNITALITAMTEAAEVHIKDLDVYFLEHPFTPPPSR